MPDEIYADVAQGIAAVLCRDAIRDGDRCNWLGDAMESVDGRLRNVHRSFSGDLYGGTSGIALFLAEADRIRPDVLFRRTARAAIEHALRDDSMTGARRLGFYTGATGIGFAAVRAGELFEEQALVDRGLALVERSSVVDDASTADILSGAAGVIGPLLALRARHEQEWMLERALAAGDHLLRHARQSERGMSWSVLGEEWATGDLTGYSHGAAGIALALLELGRATDEQRFAAAAEGAMQYERSHFSPEQQNWPDFRRASSGASSPAMGFSLGWCHGAPGIGLSRLRAYRIHPASEIVEEAAAALRGTYTPLSTLAPTSMFALCHGAAGNAELFLEAGDILGDPGYTAIAEAIGRQGVERYHEPRRPWPSGITGGGQTPGLMLGLAGIGYFYLRLHDPATVPSLLAVGPG
jgi:lantibiotic modifying enzyme